MTSIDGPSGERRRGVETLAFALVWIPYALLVKRFWFLCDDAFISFRYAQNWAAGNGVRYNLGEQLPVEGYSNFLWVALTASIDRLGGNVPAIMPWLSFACGSVLLYLVFRVLRGRLGLSLPASVLTTLTLGCSPPFAVWSTSGLETMAFVLLLFVTFERMILRPDGPAPVAAAATGIGLAMVRVEGVAWVIALGVLALAARWSSGGAARRKVLGSVAVALTGFAAWWAWRWSYYHVAFPNTAYAKVGLDGESIALGLDYVVSFCLTQVTPFALLLTGPVAFRRDRAALLPALAMTLGVGAYAVLVGGDFMTFGRFLVAALPFQALLLGGLLADLDSRPAGRAAGFALAVSWIVVGLLPAADLHVLPTKVRSAYHFRLNRETPYTELEQWRHMRDNVRERREEARLLNTLVQPGESLVHGVIGVVGYETHLFIYDILGLVNAEVARREQTADKSPGHRKSVLHMYFENRNPDYLAYKAFRESEEGSNEELRKQVTKAANAWYRRSGQRYVPEVAGDDGVVVLLMRRVSADEDRDAAWEDFRRRLDAL